jgi:hypothetical protein
MKNLESNFGLPGSDSTTNRIPIRAVYTGIYTDSGKEFNTVHDYYEFGTRIQPMADYEVSFIS